jgi:hypothetical protein
MSSAAFEAKSHPFFQVARPNGDRINLLDRRGNKLTWPWEFRTIKMQRLTGSNVRGELSRRENGLPAMAPRHSKIGEHELLLTYHEMLCKCATSLCVAVRVRCDDLEREYEEEDHYATLLPNVWYE